MKTFIIIISLIIGLLIGYYYGHGKGVERSQGISSYEECIAAGYPMMKSLPPQCATPDGKVFVGESGRYMDIESYVKNNISELAPEKEVLGGKFFVTRIQTNNGTGVVEYEDGHNAYVADFTYRILESGQSEVVSFTIRSTN